MAIESANTQQQSLSDMMAFRKDWRAYLLTYLIANVSYFLFWILVIRPTKQIAFAEMAWYHVVGPVASAALWYTYLEHSKRVRNTYSQRRGMR